jgi:disulfide bond formation protein DsbB
MTQMFTRAVWLFLAASLIAMATIGGAWFSELGLGYVPCKLCLIERWPYYLALPVVVTAFVRMRDAGARQSVVLAAAFLGLLFLVSAGLGAYHAGVEWKFWLGPTDCGGRVNTGAVNLEDFRKSLNTARVVLCNEAPMRILGLSFAGWNGVVSLGIAALYFASARKFARR